MFTIIIPLYNKAPYIEKAIQSVAAQSCQDFELIVIDDGSTDNSLEKLRVISYELGEKNPEFFAKIQIIEQKNQGVSTTRNNGVQMAKYEYIAFLDADDWWEPAFLEEMKSLIGNYPDAGIYGSNYYKIRHGQKIQPVMGVEPGFKAGYINYFNAYARTFWMPLWTGAVVVKKQVFNSVGGFLPGLKMGEDFHLWARIANNYKVAFLNNHLSNYNQDVDITNRAVEEKFYRPSEHFLFADYSALQNNTDFVRLFDLLAVYGLMPYYLAKKNKPEVEKLLSTIHWKNQSLKYRLFYRVLHRIVVKWWYLALKRAAKYKKLKKNF